MKDVISVLASLTLAWVARGDQPAPPRRADESAIREVGAAFARAFEKGDAKAVANFWTPEGEYVAGDGTTIRGRAAIEKAYAKFFADNPNARLRADVDSIRFVSRDGAVEEGVATVTREDRQTTARYSILYAREDSHWQMALVREWPDEAPPLSDLAWLIGTWQAKTALAEVRTTYEWGKSQKFIRVSFLITGPNRSVSGTEFIGRDPRTGRIRSWVFGDDGGFGEAVWTRDGKRWVQNATGVEADGDELTARNILTPIDRNSFTWQSVDRSEDGEPLADVPPVKINRVTNGQPKGGRP